MRNETAFLFDLDGTLVDSVYQHVLAWKEALDADGIELSVWRIHRRIGMSGGLFMNQLLRETHEAISPERIARLQKLTPTPTAATPIRCARCPAPARCSTPSAPHRCPGRSPRAGGSPRRP